MNTIKSAGKQSKQKAKAVVGQMAQEPFEILRTARQQVSGQEKQPKKDSSLPQKESEHKEHQPLNEEAMKQKSLRRLEAHRSELESMKSQKTFEELQKRISEGEDVPVQNFAELSMEQKQVLNAQKEAVGKQKEILAFEKPLVEPSTKRGRGLLKGMKGKLDRIKRKAEIRMGPSG